MSDDIRVGSIWESKGSGMLARVVAYDVEEYGFHADRTCSCGGQGTAWNDTGTEHGSEPITCDCVHTPDNRCTPDCVEVD